MALYASGVRQVPIPTLNQHKLANYEQTGSYSEPEVRFEEICPDGPQSAEIQLRRLPEP